MPKYLVLVKYPTVMEVEAASENDALQTIRQQLIVNNQIKEADPIEIQIVREVSIDE